MPTCSIGDWAKAKLSYALDAMTLIQQSDKEKLLILKTKAHSFHTANLSYRHISSHFFQP